MRGRIVAAFVAGVLCCALFMGAAFGAFYAFSDDAQAQSGGAWQLAGGSQGFSIADWGMGLGPERSIDDWIESMPIECDIQTIARGVSFVSVYYRCPDA